MILYEHGSQRRLQMPKILENVKENLIKEARNMLLEKSYAELNIREIAKNCGIGIGTFYNYFSNKELLIAEIFRSDWKVITAVVDSATTQDIPFKEKCRAVYKALDQFIQLYNSVFYELSMTAGMSQRGCQETNKYDLLYTQMEGMIATGQKDGSIQSSLSPEQLSRLLISSFIFASRHEYISFDDLFDSFKV